jgi:hypothetical protein
MALHYDTTKVNKDAFVWDENDRSQQYGIELEVMAFNTMFLGINEITADNWQEFYSRYVLNNFDKMPSELFVTPAMVKRWIGLSTNASKITQFAFQKSVFARYHKWALDLADNAE